MQRHTDLDKSLNLSADDATAWSHANRKGAAPMIVNQHRDKVFKFIKMQKLWAFWNGYGDFPRKVSFFL